MPSITARAMLPAPMKPSLRSGLRIVEFSIFSMYIYTYLCDWFKQKSILKPSRFVLIIIKPIKQYMKNFILVQLFFNDIGQVKNL
jgi:hypothetical protein